MIDFITSYLVQEKSCELPGLGKFVIKAHQPELDFAAKKIFPPQYQVLYSPETIGITPGLVSYVAAQKNIQQSEAHSEIEQWCEQAKRKVQLFGSIDFLGLGKLQKSVTGSVFFQRENFVTAYDEVVAEKVVHTDEPHEVLVGDKLMDSHEALALYEAAQATAGNQWMWIALMLSLIGICVLFYHFFMLHSSGWGNQILLFP